MQYEDVPGYEIEAKFHKNYDPTVEKRLIDDYIGAKKHKIFISYIRESKDLLSLIEEKKKNPYKKIEEYLMKHHQYLLGDDFDKLKIISIKERVFHDLVHSGKYVMKLDGRGEPCGVEEI